MDAVVAFIAFDGRSPWKIQSRRMSATMKSTKKTISS